MSYDLSYYHLICTAAKEGCISICVSLTFFSVIARVVKTPPIRCGLATVSIFVADFHHSATSTLIPLSSACLDGNF